MNATYLLNVALHGAILSVFASLAMVAMHQARHRSVTAIAALLAVGFLPWVTALRPAQHAPDAEIQSPEAASLVTWTVITLPVTQKAIPTPAEDAASPAENVFPDPVTTFAVIWAAGTGIGLLLLTIAALEVRSWRRSLVRMDEATWQTLQSLVPEIQVCPRFRLSETHISPCVTGIFEPVIIMPRFLLASKEELCWAIRHEIAHWQAGDSRWMFLFALIRCSNWWNPLVHRLVSHWADAREQLCDLHAAGISDRRADYGEFLVAMAGKVSQQPPLAVAMAKRPYAARLKRRIICLLEAGAGPVKPAGKSFVAIGSAVFISVAAIISSVKIRADEIGPETGAAVQLAVPEKPPTPEPLRENTAVPPQRPANNEPAQPAPPVAQPDAARQIKISSKLILTDFKPGFAEAMSKEGPFTIASLLSDQQFELTMRGFAQKRGTSLCTTPSVTARSGQPATIEINWPITGTPEQVAGREPESEIPFVGISLAFTPRFPPGPNNFSGLVPAAGAIELEQKVDYRFVPGIYHPLLDTSSKPPDKIDPEKIKSINRSINGRITSGFTVCSDLGEIEPGKFLTVFTRVDAIDAEGRLLDENGKTVPNNLNRNDSDPTSGRKIPDGRTDPPDALPSPEVKGRLILHAVWVEIPLKTARPPGEGMPIGLTPSDAKVADKIKNDPRAKVRKLKTVEMPLNQQGAPWPEFPNLSVSATASKDFKLINITSHAVVDQTGQFPNIWEEVPSGSIMSFGIKTDDPAIERRLLITVEAVK